MTNKRNTEVKQNNSPLREIITAISDATWEESIEVCSKKPQYIWDSGNMLANHFWKNHDDLFIGHYWYYWCRPAYWWIVLIEKFWILRSLLFKRSGLGQSKFIMFCQDKFWFKVYYLWNSFWPKPNFFNPSVFCSFV